MLHYSYHGWDELKSPVSNTTFWSSVRISKSNIKSYSESYRFTEHFVISFDIYQSTRAPVVGFTLRLLSIFTVVCEPRRYFANYPRQISVCCSSRLDFPRLNELLLLSWPPLLARLRENLVGAGSQVAAVPPAAYKYLTSSFNSGFSEKVRIEALMRLIYTMRFSYNSPALISLTCSTDPGNLNACSSRYHPHSASAPANSF